MTISLQHHSLSKQILGILIIFGLLVLPNCHPLDANKIIEKVFPSSDSPISAYGWVGVTFSQEIDKDSVTEAFSISPALEGTTFWKEDTFWFRPIQPFERDVAYQARLVGELQSPSGRTFSLDQTWTFTIRQPDLIYYVPMAEGGEIWRVNSGGGQAQQLSFTDGNVIDFAPDRSGSQIAFTVLNGSQGSDLWVMDREGDGQRLLVGCNQDLCSEPAWSMDRSRVAFTRQVYNPESGGYYPAKVWMVEILSGDSDPLLHGEDLQGQSPSFSPDGRWGAFYDPIAEAIRIFDLATYEVKDTIPRALPGAGDWSPDSQKLIYTDLVPAHHEPFVEVYIYDLETQTINRAFDEATSDTEFSQPRWAPDANWIAVSLRPVNAALSKALWVLPLIERDPILIDDDQTATFSAYQWNPWGDSLLYQRYDLSSSDPRGSIWRWDWRTRQNMLLIEDGLRPQWLP